MSKKQFAFVVDSTTFITEELRKHPDVYVIPLYITFGQEQFKDGELSIDELYERIKNSPDLPKTSQPPAGEFAELYSRLSKDYEAIIAIHVSSKLSGTLSSSVAGAKIAEITLEGVDSRSLSYGITGLVEKGLQLAQQGMNYSEIADALRQEVSRFRNYILMGNLTQFYKGGRMGGLQFFLGSVLQIKPIIQINAEGELEVIDKVRSHKKALQYLLQKASDDIQKEHVQQVSIMHSNVPDQADELAKLISSKYPHVKIVIGDITTTLAVHAGEGTVAVLWYVPENK